MTEDGEGIVRQIQDGKAGGWLERIAMMVMTISNSIRVKAYWARGSMRRSIACIRVFKKMSAHRELTLQSRASGCCTQR